MSTDPAPKDQREFNTRIVEMLELFDIPYAIGGSIAAMYYSRTPRLTNDVDFMVDVNLQNLELLVDAVESWPAYIDPLEAIIETYLPARMPINILDGMLGAKADLFFVAPDGLDASSMSRRRRQKLYVKPEVQAWFLAPEDVILYKLAYFQMSEGVSQKHPKDIHNMLRAVERDLDVNYLEHWAAATGVLGLWRAILTEYQA